MGIRSLNGAMSVLGCTTRATEHSNNPPHFPQAADIQQGEKNRERMSPEKAMGNLCYNICQSVVTCWCWRTTGNKVLVLFKWLPGNFDLTDLEVYGVLLETDKVPQLQLHSCVYIVPIGILSIGIGKYCLGCWTFPQHMPGIPSSGSCNHTLVFFLPGSCGSFGLWRH